MLSIWYGRIRIVYKWMSALQRVITLSFLSPRRRHGAFHLTSIVSLKCIFSNLNRVRFALPQYSFLHCHYWYPSSRETASTYNIIGIHVQDVSKEKYVTITNVFFLYYYFYFYKKNYTTLYWKIDIIIKKLDRYTIYSVL